VSKTQLNQTLLFWLSRKYELLKIFVEVGEKHFYNVENATTDINRVRKSSVYDTEKHPCTMQRRRKGSSSLRWQ